MQQIYNISESEHGNETQSCSPIMKTFDTTFHCCLQMCTKNYFDFLFDNNSFILLQISCPVFFRSE